MARLLHGGWVLLTMAVIAALLGVVIGTAAGVFAAYTRGWRDGFIMRTADVVLAIPTIVFGLLLVSVLGAQLWLIVLAVAISHGPPVARVMRAAALDVAERDFVKAVELQGVKQFHILFREVLPNLMSPLMVEAGLRLTYSIIFITGLSFLGFGQQPPAANWGSMINENRPGVELNVWGVLAPVVVVALLTVGVNTFTDAYARVAIGIGRRVGDVEFQTAAVDNERA